jgi:hypothetical protein
MEAPQSTQAVPTSPSATCSNPAEALCKKEENPAVVVRERIEREVIQLNENAKNKPEVQNFIKANGGKNHCFELSTDNFVKCQEMIQKQVSESVYTPKRKEKAEELFKKQKKSFSLI